MGERRKRMACNAVCADTKRYDEDTTAGMKLQRAVGGGRGSPRRKANWGRGGGGGRRSFRKAFLLRRPGHNLMTNTESGGGRTRPRAAWITAGVARRRVVARAMVVIPCAARWAGGFGMGGRGEGLRSGAIVACRRRNNVRLPPGTRANLLRPRRTPGAPRHRAIIVIDDYCRYLYGHESL